MWTCSKEFLSNRGGYTTQSRPPANNQVFLDKVLCLLTLNTDITSNSRVRNLGKLKSPSTPCSAQAVIICFKAKEAASSCQLRDGWLRFVVCTVFPLGCGSRGGGCRFVKCIHTNPATCVCSERGVPVLVCCTGNMSVCGIWMNNKDTIILCQTG